MMPIRKGLLSLAIHDDAVFHACLSQYAASYNLRFQTGDPVESIQHRIEGIRILNDRLGDPIKGLSDGSIAAVANIAIYEVCYEVCSNQEAKRLANGKTVCQWVSFKCGSPSQWTGANGQNERRNSGGRICILCAAFDCMVSEHVNR